MSLLRRERQCLSSTASWYRRENDHSGPYAHAALGCSRLGHPARGWSAAGVLACVFTAALEVLYRGLRLAPYRVASDRAGLLCSGRHRSAEPVWTLVSVAHRP